VFILWSKQFLYPNFTLFYFVCVTLLHFYELFPILYCYFTHMYVFTVISMICNICSSVISFSFLICMCNVAISTVLMYCFVTLVRLSLVTNKSYLLTYLLTDLFCSQWMWQYCNIFWIWSCRVPFLFLLNFVWYMTTCKICQ